MDEQRLTDLIAQQVGVVSRRQVVAAGFDDSWIEKRLRRRDWARVHTGVYVDHTGPLLWWQRAWAAVLFYWPAALCHESALQAQGLRSVGYARREALSSGPAGRPTLLQPDRGVGDAAHGGPGYLDASGPMHVAVGQERRVSAIPSVHVHRVMDLAGKVQPNREPPRLHLEHTLLDVASKATSDVAALAVLADACQVRRTTAARLLVTLAERPRLPRRRFLTTVLDDIAAGTYSVLEHRYLVDVERAHGLPTGRRQRRVQPGRSSAYRDVEYLGLHTVVELDGRLGHEESLDRWADMDRDVASMLLGDATLRIGWRQVEEPCRTAMAVARVITQHGWPGSVRACSTECRAHALSRAHAFGRARALVGDSPAVPAETSPTNP